LVWCPVLFVLSRWIVVFFAPEAGDEEGGQSGDDVGPIGGQKGHVLQHSAGSTLKPGIEVTLTSRDKTHQPTLK